MEKEHFQAPESQKKSIKLLLLVKIESNRESWMRSEMRTHSNKNCRCYLYYSKQVERNVWEGGINFHAVYPTRTLFPLKE